MTNPASDTVTLNTMVARLNIEHFLKRLSVELDETKRQTLLNLIAEETVKLSGMVAHYTKRRDQRVAARSAMDKWEQSGKPKNATG